MMRLLAFALVVACSSGTVANVRRVVVSAPATDGYKPISEPAACSALCARFAKPNEAATCHPAKAVQALDDRYGTRSFIMCRLERQ